MGQELNGRLFCVVGAATAGAEAAQKLAESGAKVVVLEQNPRPFGKIEDGLPRWHERQREREYQKIIEKLEHPNVYFVPSTKVGEDIPLEELVEQWGFDAVLLAVGAWRDRPLGIPGAEEYIDRGIVYQNPLVYWFNHYLEPHFADPGYQPVDGALVVGGGLASIDVAKILMVETTARRLEELGHEVDVLELERDGIPKTLAALGVTREDLALQGCTIIYRRRQEDMPVVAIPPDATPEAVEKVRAARTRLVDKAMEKYGFNLLPLAVPERLIVENDRVVGLVLRRTRVENGRVHSTDETFERRAPLVVSSIGSIPEPLPGIPLRGELYHFGDGPLPRLNGFNNVFGIGNAVTGQGNIVASRRHAAEAAETVAAMLMGLEPWQEWVNPFPEASQTLLTELKNGLTGAAPSPEQRQEGIRRAQARQREIDYPGDVRKWLERHGYPAAQS